MPNPYKIKIPAGETRDAGFYVNRTGTLDVVIRTRDESNVLDEVWWITWGVGGISSLGRKHEQFTTKIPVRWWKGIVTAKLRARAVGSDTLLVISVDAHNDASISFQW
jgi:hypothetical protein